MATFLRSDPNPVIITIWSASQQGPCTISWDTGISNVSGTIWVTDAQGTRKLVGTDKKAAVGVKGSSPAHVALAQTTKFEMKRTDNPTVVIASINVEAREEIGLPRGVLLDLGERLAFAQGINGLRVLPDVDWVRILFKTRQPAIPIVEIHEVASGALAAAVFPIFAGATQSHDHTFSLAQDTDFRFHIFAPPATGSTSTKAAEVSGQFRTGQRKAKVFFDRVDVHTDGDPGSLGEGEFWFNMGIGNIDGGEMLGVVDVKHDMSGGDSYQLGRSVTADHAPIGVWVQVRAEEDDTTFSHFTGPAFVSFAPEGSTWDHFSSHGETEVATVTKWFDLSDAGAVAQEIPFILETGPKHIDFSLHGRLVTERRPGIVVQPLSTKSAKPILRTQTTTTLVRGDRAEVTGRETHELYLAHDASLYHTHVPTSPRAKKARRKAPWTHLASEVCDPVTVVAVGDLLHVLMLDKDGRAMHQVQPTSAGQKVDAWRSLGGSFVAPLAVATRSHAIDVFGLNAEGQVFHGDLAARHDVKWERIGDGIAGSLNAFVTQRGGVSIVAVGRDGDIRHLDWSAHAPACDSSKWNSLGAAPLGALRAEVFLDVVVLAALADDETVHAASWRQCPELPDRLNWRVLGTIDSLVNARFSLLPAKEPAG